MRRALAPLALAAAILALCAAPAAAGEYDPGTVPPEATATPERSGRVLRVGPRARGGIQRAVDRARQGDTVRIARGVYRGNVVIRGASKRGLRVVADGATLRGRVEIRDTAHVTLQGLSLRGGGVVIRDVDRYALRSVRVQGAPGNGIDVRRSVGGSLRRVLSAGNGAAGIALGGTPQRIRAVRTFIRESTVRDNAVGIALDRMRFVTVSRVRLPGNREPVLAVDSTDIVLDALEA